MHPSQDGCKDHTATVSNVNDQPFSAEADPDQSETKLTHDRSMIHALRSEHSPQKDRFSGSPTRLSKNSDSSTVPGQAVSGGIVSSLNQSVKQLNEYFPTTTSTHYVLPCTFGDRHLADVAAVAGLMTEIAASSIRIPTDAWWSCATPACLVNRIGGRDCVRAGARVRGRVRNSG